MSPRKLLGLLFGIPSEVARSLRESYETEEYHKQVQSLDTKRTMANKWLKDHDKDLKPVAKIKQNGSSPVVSKPA